MNFLEIYIVCVIVHRNKMAVQEPMYEQVIQVSIWLRSRPLLVIKFSIFVEIRVLLY